MKTIKFAGMLLVLVSMIGLSHAGDYNALSRVEWAPSGDKMLVRPVFNKAEVYNQNGQLLWSLDKLMGDAAFSIDGTQLVYVVPGDGFYRYDFPSKKEITLEDLQSTRNQIMEIAWAPTAKTVGYWVAPFDGKSHGFPRFVTIGSNGQNRKIIRDAAWPSVMVDPNPKPVASSTPEASFASFPPAQLYPPGSVNRPKPKETPIETPIAIPNATPVKNVQP